MAGMSVRGLARSARTSASTLSAYERSLKSPTWTTTERITRAAGFEPVVTLVPHAPAGTYPVATLVVDLRASDEADRLRLVFEFVARWHEFAGSPRAHLVLEDPGSSRDERWDALVGGLVEHLCWHDGIEAPGWVGAPERFLDRLWWPVDAPVVRIWALEDAPASLLRHGVVLSRADLVRV
jgi:transcriptional regulator with XRE-family HTH domain